MIQLSADTHAGGHLHQVIVPRRLSRGREATSGWSHPDATAGPGVGRAAREHRALQAAHGLNHPVVLLRRRRLQRELRSVEKTGETFGLSAFFRDGDAVYRNDHTNGPGVEMLGSA